MGNVDPEAHGSVDIAVWSAQVRQARQREGARRGAPDDVLELAFEELSVAEEELRVQEQQLAESCARLAVERQHYRSLFEQAPVPYLVTDTDGVIREANAAAAELLGIAREHVRGKPLAAFIAPAARRAFRTDLAAWVDSGTNATAVLNVLPRHDELRVVTATVGIVHPTHDAAAELRWLLVDETARRRLERDLADHNAELEARVAARTAELEALATEREDLLRAEARARLAAVEADRAKTELLTTVSHELRTPLTAVGGYAEILLAGFHGELNERQRTDVRRIRQAQAHASQLLDDLLVYFRAAGGRLVVEPVDVPVAEVVAGATPMVDPQAAACGVAVRVAECDRALLVRADPERLRQIVVNLLANAVKYTGAGGVVELSWRTSGGDVLIDVRDTGVGISAEGMAVLFEPFVQLEQRGRGAGFGLGLAISRELARAMGGDITVASAPRVGSTFTVRLPTAG